MSNPDFGACIVLLVVYMHVLYVQYCLQSYTPQTNHGGQPYILRVGLPSLLFRNISSVFRTSGWRWVDGKKPIPTALRIAFAILRWLTGLRPVFRECSILPIDVTYSDNRL